MEHSDPARGVQPDSAAQVTKLELNPDGSLVLLAPGNWFICFVPGIEKQWWHRFVNRKHTHVFAIRPERGGYWTVFEPWWTRIVVATITSDQARKFLTWGAQGDVLLVPERIPGNSSQVRGWANCAVLTSQLLGRKYWLWSPHQLYKRLLNDPDVCWVDMSALLQWDLSALNGSDTAPVEPCDACKPGAPRQPGAKKPFCMKCGRSFYPVSKVAAKRTDDAA